MKSLEDLKKIRDEAAKNLTIRSTKGGKKIVVGMATCGISAGARLVLAAFVEEITTRNIPNVIVTQTGCIGECQYEPIVQVYDENNERTIYANVHVEDVNKIIDEHILAGKVVTEKTLEHYKG